MSKILLTTLAYSNPDLLDKCLDSWYKHIPAEVDKGLLWQGYTNPEMEPTINKYLDKLNVYQRRINNWAVAGGWNILLREAFVKNNYSAVVIVGSDTAFLNNKFWNTIESNYHEAYDFVESSHQFNCFIISNTCFEQVGLFDENFFNYVEDDDYRIRVKKTGIKYINNCGDRNLFYHYESATVRRNPLLQLRSRRSFDLNRKYMHKKWGGVEHTNPKWKPVYCHPFDNKEWPLDKWILDPEQRKKQLWHNIIDDDNDDRLMLLVNALNDPDKHQYTNES